MYAYLEGTFMHQSPGIVFVDVNGIGFEVHISLNTFSAIRDMDRGRLFTHLQVKEDAHTLFGFFSKQEKDIFLMLLGVSGVGASTARMMLSSLQPDELVAAISGGNTRLLEGVKGIGRKTAERIVLELKDKVGRVGSGQSVTTMAKPGVEQDVLAALISLGVAKNQAEQAIQKVKQSEPGIDDLESFIKKALKAI